MAEKAYKRAQHELTEEQSREFDARLDFPDLIVTGDCPRCGHETVYPHPLVGFQGVNPMDAAQEKKALKAAESFGVEPVPEADFTMVCDCPVAHPKQPPGVEGCGAYWPFHAEWG